MKFRQLAAVAGATLVTCFSLANKGQAVTLVSAEIDSYVPKPTDTVLGTCSQIGSCFPGQVLPASTSIFPFVSQNDSSFDVTSIILTIDPDQDAIWSNGSSNIYSNIQISPDAKTLTLSGGVIPVGEFLFSDAPTNPPNTPVGFSIAFEGTPSAAVPEPSSVLGTLVFSAIGAGSLLKRQLKHKARKV